MMASKWSTDGFHHPCFLSDAYVSGADETGEPELFPSPERLYRALASVAYGVFGFESTVSQESVIDDQSVRDALAWLEGNPPDAIRLPTVAAGNRRNTMQAVAYRDRGSWDKKHCPAVKSASACSSVAYDVSEAGDLVWQWQESPSPRIAEVLGDLCWEIPYLGEACAPVHVVTENEDEYPLPGSLQQMKSLSISSLQSMIDFHIPWNGHLQELQRGYMQAYPKRVSKPSGTEQEKNVLSNTLYEFVRRIGYVDVKSENTEDKAFISPWPRCFFIPVRLPRGWQPRENQFVAWAVAMHRLLVRQWGSDVSPMLTGRYLIPDGFGQRPANNVAIHILTSDTSSVVDEGLRDILPGFLIMVPHDMPADEVSKLAAICCSVEGRSLFYSARQNTLKLGKMRELESSHIWGSVPDGETRFWLPYPLCMRETYPVKHPADRKRRWGVKESIALAVGHVLRDSFLQTADRKAMDASDQCGETDSNLGDRNDYWSLVERVCAADSPVRIYNAHPESRTKMADYVHRTQRNAFLSGASAWLSFSDDCGLNQTVMAIGQSRHLGGGLLVPLDIPNFLIDGSGRPVHI